MPLANIQLTTPVYQLNITVLMSVVVFCLTAMGTIVKIFGRTTKPEELPGKNSECLQSKKDIDKLQTQSEELRKKDQELKEIITKLNMEVEILKRNSSDSNNSIEKIKENNRILTGKLEEMIRELLEYGRD